MAKNNTAIIIGAGLGGLECAYILARNGLKVTVLEHNRQIGGCLQCFRRGGAEFDTGFHYIGGLREGESLYPLFRYFNLLHLPWHQLDPEGFDEVRIGDRSYFFANGYDRFAERLTESFPAQRENLKAYTALLKKVGDHIFDAFEPRESETFHATSLFAESAYGYLDKTITDPLLRKVLSGTSLKMELSEETLPLYIFAQINSSFIQSAWRLAGGGNLVTDSLAADIRAMGGEIITGATVTEMTEKDGRVSSVTVNGTDHYEADWIISSAHPAKTLDLIRESACIRRMYRKRITSLENTCGMFTINAELKENALNYRNRNIFIHPENADLWNPADAGRSMMLSFGVPRQENDAFAHTLDILTPMSWNEVEPWKDQPFGKRGPSYQEMKERKTAECLEKAERALPGISAAVARVWTSTPLTYSHYTLTPQGTAYGIRKDWRNTMGTVLAPRTPLSNLVLTGQNLNLHGVLGVSMTSVISASMILGMDLLKQQIFNS